MSNQSLAVSNNKVLESVSTRVRQFQDNGEIHFPANYSPENALKAHGLLFKKRKTRIKNLSCNHAVKRVLQTVC